MPGFKRWAAANCSERLKEPQQSEMLSRKPLDAELQELKTKYLAEAQQTNIFHANLYVPARRMATHREGAFGPVEASWKVSGTRLTPQSMSNPGAGNPLFNHYLAAHLWQASYEQSSSMRMLGSPFRYSFHWPISTTQLDTITTWLLRCLRGGNGLRRGYWKPENNWSSYSR